MKLVRADVNDCDKIWDMQIKAFADLLEKYQDYETNPGNENWELDTILQEKGNCHLYEKLGYKKTGIIENINERMDIVYYEKD